MAVAEITADDEIVTCTIRFTLAEAAVLDWRTWLPISMAQHLTRCISEVACNQIRAMSARSRGD